MFRRLVAKLHKNNKGMSIVTVIVAIGFALVLVNALLLTSTINYKMRNVNVYSKDSFYSAEQVLDEINVGLQQVVSDGISNAYMKVLTNYDTTEMSTAEKNELVKAYFYEHVEKELAVKTGKGYSYIAMPADAASLAAKHSTATTQEGLYGLLKESTRWHNEGGDQSKAYGAFLRTGGVTDVSGAVITDYTLPDGSQAFIGPMIESNKDGIYLRDLYIYYRDSNGFVSTIKTDIHLVYPEFSFDNTDVPEISKYCFVTDTKLSEKHTGVGKALAYTTTVKGDSYAYAVETSGTILDYAPTATGSDLIVIGSEANITNGGIKTYNSTELWADDIVVKSSDVELAGNTYLQDDLNLKGRGCNLKILGNYTGYGNSVDDSSDSSAILVNGVDTTIDLQYVNKFSLAGRAFVSFTNSTTKDKADGTKAKIGVDSNDTDKKTLDIYTGSSIGAKSDQLMYLVPADCLGVALTDDGTGNKIEGDSIYGQNPMTQSQFNDVASKVNNGEATMVAINKPVAKLGGDKLGQYLKDGNSVQAVHIRSASGTDSLVYYYMKFTDEDAANLFFAKYYGLNKAAVNEYMEKYIKAIDLPSSGNVSLKVSLAGNAVTDNSASASTAYGSSAGTRDTAGFIRSKNGYDTISESLQGEFDNYSKQFEGYSTKLSADLQTIAATLHVDRSGDNKAVFRNLVNMDSLKEVASGGRVDFKDGDGKVRAVVIYDSTAATLADNLDKATTVAEVEAATKALNDHLANHSDTINGNDVNLVITNGSVKVTGSKFTGTILAMGEIVVPGTGNYTFEADSKKVDECMFLTTDDGVYSVADVFKDALDLQATATVDASGDVSDIKINDLVILENWTKNVDVK